MKQSPSRETKSRSGSQEIPRLLRNPMVHYRAYNSLPLAPILIQMHLIHTFSPYFPKTRSNIILLSTLISSEWSLLSYLILLQLISQIISGETASYEALHYVALSSLLQIFFSCKILKFS
jgi:hypothetical protein